MVFISQKIYAKEEVFNLPFDKFPLASFYNEYPFLIINNFLSKNECHEIINSLDKNEKYKAKIISNNNLNESIRKTILHNPTDKLRELFHKRINKYKNDIEKFFGVSLLKGTDIQILEYKEGGHYNCHADNASVIMKNNHIVGYKVVRSERKLTTLLFLNEDFLGGEIEFCHLRYYNNKRVILKPKIGMMIVFPSHGLFAHKVFEIKKGKRFAIVKWWNVI